MGYLARVTAVDLDTRRVTVELVDASEATMRSLGRLLHRTKSLASVTITELQKSLAESEGRDG